MTDIPPDVLKDHGIAIASEATVTFLKPTVVEECVEFATDSVFKASKIGSFTYFNRDNYIYNTRSIGRYCSFGQDILIGMGSHPTNWLSTSTLFYRRAMWADHEIVADFYADNDYTFHNPDRLIVIGNDVWCGSSATLRTSVTIGDGAVIAAKSMVTKDVPPYAIVGGVPARVIKYRFDEETIADLLELKWWNVKPHLLKNLEYSDIRRAIEDIRQRKADNPDWEYKPRLLTLA